MYSASIEAALARWFRNVAPKLYPQVGQFRFSRPDLQIHVQSGLFQFGITQLDDNRVRGDFCSRLNQDPLDKSLCRCRNPSDLLRDQTTETPDFEQHLPLLNCVGVQGLSVHRWRGWFQARYAEGGDDAD